MTVVTVTKVVTVVTVVTVVGVFYPPHLAKFGEHDHNGGVVFPQHPPEVLGGLC